MKPQTDTEHRAQTDEEIRAEFDAAAARQKPYPRSEERQGEFLNYTSAGAVRKR